MQVLIFQNEETNDNQMAGNSHSVPLIPENAPEEVVEMVCVC